MAIKIYQQPARTTTTPAGTASVNRKQLNKQLSDSKTRLGAFNTLGAGIPEDITKITTAKPRLSFLERLGAVADIGQTSTALYEYKYGRKKGDLGEATKTFFKTSGRLAAATVTGKREFLDFDRKFYSDIAKREGVDNAVARFGIGFLGDVLLNPTTWFGGGIVRGALKGVTKGTGLAVRGIDKVAPGFAAGSGAVKDALGKAFVFGYGASPGVVERVATGVGRGDKAARAILQSNFKRLGTNTLSKEQNDAVANAFINLKRGEHAVGKGTIGAEMLTTVIKEGIKDKTVARVIKEQAKRSRKLAIQHTPLEEGDLFQYYFSTGDKTKMKRVFDGSRAMRQGSENYLKKTAEIVARENIQKDLPTAYGRVESEMVRNAAYKKTLKDIVSSVGKPADFFADADEAAKFGWKLLKSKGEKLGYVLDNDHRVIQSLMYPGAEFAAVDALAKATGFDVATNLFKRFVTGGPFGIFAPFYVRNAASGQMQAYEAVGRMAFHPHAVGNGINLAAKITFGRGLKTNSAIPGSVYRLKDVSKALVDRFGLTQGIATEGYDNTIKALPKFFSKEATVKSLKTGFLGQESQAFRSAQKINNFIEVQNKAQITIAGLMKGLNMEDALKLAEVGAFDYRNLTGFESKVLRRIIPFYAFSRKNIELQARTLANKPARVFNIIKLIRDIGTNMTTEQVNQLPEYMRRAFTIKFGEDENGNPIVTSSLGTPIEQISQLISGNPVLNGISQMNPLLKAPLELGFGKDSFRQRDLKDVYDAKEYSAAPKIIKDLLLITEVEKPIYKNNKDTGKVKTVYVADPVRLLIARSLFTSRGFTYLDQIFDGDLNGLAKYLKLTTGIKLEPVDQEKQEYFNKKDVEDKAKDILLRRGKVKSYESIYVPKPKAKQQTK